MDRLDLPTQMIVYQFGATVTNAILFSTGSDHQKAKCRHGKIGASSRTEYEIQLSKFYGFVLTIVIGNVGQYNPIFSFLGPKPLVCMKEINLNCDRKQAAA